MSFLQNLTRPFRSVEEYINAVVSAVFDGSVSPQEWHQLHSLAAKLGMTVEERTKAHARAVERLMQGFMADGYLDQREIDLFEQACQALGVTANQIDPALGVAVADMVSLQRIVAGQLPTVHASQCPLVLKPGEIAHLMTPCRMEENKVVARRHVGGYSGVSFRIARGVRYHVGGCRGYSYPVTANVVVGQGMLVITSQRIAYLGNTKGFNKPWAKVSCVEAYNNAVTFYFMDRQSSSTLLYSVPRVGPYVEAVCGRLLS